MAPREIPVSIENRWDLFYRDYPEIYDRFGRVSKTPTAVEALHQRFPLTGKTVADIGSGSGLSTFELAQFAKAVVGVEPEAAMRELALRAAQDQGLDNVTFLEGSAEAMPLADASVDGVVGVTLASLYKEANVLAFAREAQRVVRPGGQILLVDVARGWYGGELAAVILDDPENVPAEIVHDETLRGAGFQFADFITTQDYGSVENAVQTYGFIFGKKVIAYLREHNQSVIRWKFSIHHKTVG
jgi:ubiquinone/menaquinone biosynthesis C-methylase UbiE